MADTKETKKADTSEVNETEQEVQDNGKYIFLKTPIDFEGENYEKIDLSGLDELTGNDLKKIDRMYRRISRGITAMTKELDLTYIQLVAAEATGLPIEFFDALKAKDSTTVEVVVRNFLLY
jgi:hypothetical protein